MLGLWQVEDGLEVGVEEVGFKYKGPEPTSFGDWAHKGRAPRFRESLSHISRLGADT